MEEVLRQIEGLPEFEIRPIRHWDGSEWLEEKKFRGIAEKGPDRLVSIVTKRYRLIQLKDSFKLAISQLRDIEGEVAYYVGRASLYLYPKGEHCGIRIENSVDRTSALRVDYIVRLQGYSLTIPKKLVKAFARRHTGRTPIVYEDFLSVITSVKQVWETIASKLRNKIVSNEEAKNLLKAIKAGKKLRERAKEVFNEPVNFLTAITKLIELISLAKYKTDWHKRHKLDRVSSLLLNYALFEAIG